MRKRLSSLLLGLVLVASATSCSQNPPSSASSTGLHPAATPAGSISRISVEAGMGKSASSDSAPKPAPAVPKQGYVHEVESANYLIAQNKRSTGSSGRARAVGSMTPGGKSNDASTGSTEGGDSTSSYLATKTTPLSTFAADVDTASYANLRRSLLGGHRPSPDSVRVEEMLNYFSYDLPEPKAGEPFSVTTELSDCPWNQEARLLRLAIKTKSIDVSERPPCNLVFLLDVSGSMSAPDKLPLLKSSLKTLVDNLDDADRIAIVTYAGASGLVLPSTPASERATILESIDRLEAGGSTNGASGIELAYQVARESGSDGSVNRVILATDGDFNVGVASTDELKSLIEEKRKSGPSLSVLGFGTGNDVLMETLADHGNGNYAAIDTALEARKVLVEEAGATLVTVAKDVKFQIAFDPTRVEKYRLLGYENRRLADQDFANDAKDAGDLGAGHSVTVLYEIVPAKSETSFFGSLLGSDQIATLKLRYKEPTEDVSELREVPVPAQKEMALDDASADHRWAVAVTQFGLSLHGDPRVGETNMAEVLELAQGATDKNDDYRQEFLRLVELAKGQAS